MRQGKGSEEGAKCIIADQANRQTRGHRPKAGRPLIQHGGKAQSDLGRPLSVKCTHQFQCHALVCGGAYACVIRFESSFWLCDCAS